MAGAEKRDTAVRLLNEWARIFFLRNDIRERGQKREEKAIKKERRRQKEGLSWKERRMRKREGYKVKD